MNKNCQTKNVDKDIVDGKYILKRYLKGFKDIVKLRSLCGKEIIVTVAEKVV